MTTDVGLRARVNVKIIVRDYWNNPGKKLCGLTQNDDPWDRSDEFKRRQRWQGDRFGVDI